MARRAATKLTLQQFYQLPESEIQYELVRGYLVREPPPGGRHGFVAARMCFALQQYIHDGGRPGLVLTCDTWFELSRQPATVRGPDVAYITLERYLALEDPNRAVPGAPDLAVEVLSPSQSLRAMRSRVEDYVAAGAGEVWVIDPVGRDVVAYRSGHPDRRFCTDDRLSAEHVLPGFSVPVVELLEPVLPI